jgi:hypothetical protein
MFFDRCSLCLDRESGRQLILDYAGILEHAD